MPLPTVSDINWDDFIINLGDTTAFVTKFEAYLAARNLTNGEQDVLLQAMVDWTNTPEDTLIPAVSGGNEVDDYSIVHWFAKTLAEKVAAEAEKLAAQAASAAAEAWAITPEDTLVPASAGGNEVDDYSALHHRIKAAIANGIDDNATGLLTTYSSTKIEQGLLDSKGATNNQLANIALNAFNIAVNGGMSVQNMVDGISDTFTDETGIDTGRSIGEIYDAGRYLHAIDVYEYPPAHSDVYVKATSVDIDPDHAPYRATDPAASKTGSAVNTTWRSENGVNTNQRFHIDLGSPQRLAAVEYDNYHDAGGVTTRGAKNFTLWGSNEASAFADVAYSADTNWTQLSPSVANFDKHTTADAAETKVFTVNSSEQYRYFAFKIADNWGGASFIGLRNVSLISSLPNACALITQPSTALATPSEALVVIQQEDVVASALNDNLTAWVTRTPLSIYTTLAATDNKLRLTAHGFSDGDRVILSTATGDNFPVGLDGVTAYYVVNATASDFEVSLTSGGAAVAITADNGATQNVAAYSQALLAESAPLATGRILTGAADLDSQAAGTEIRTVLLIDDSTEVKIHALSTQWA